MREYARIRTHARARPCAREEESDRFDLGVSFFFFFLPGRISPLRPLSRYPPFFEPRARIINLRPADSSEDTPRVRRREDRSGSLVRSLRYARVKALPFAPSPPDNFRDSSALSVYRGGLARQSAGTSALMKPRRFDDE